MQHQFYDSEEESEPRVTPKPVSKFHHSAVPTVPEVSLIFEKPKPQSRNDTAVRTKTFTSPVWSNRDSCHDRWKQRNYYSRADAIDGGTNSHCATHVDSLAHKNVYGHDHGSNYAPCSQGQTRDKQNEPAKTRIAQEHGTSPERSVEQRTRLSPLKGQIALQRTMRNLTDDRCVSINDQRSQIPRYDQRHPQFCLPDYSNCAVDNNETVKTLLQLINSQNEQIRNLQLQIDRLVRMQEESFRKPACACRIESPSENYRDATVDSAAVAEYPTSQPAKENQPLIPVDESDQLEQQRSKKAFVEQKVSIGVMTSFEFTVQNSPFSMESEMYERRAQEAPAREVPANKINARNVNVNVHDASSESAKRYKNTFARKPGAAQLENIVEDSESHLSSSQQQSSNFNASSVRDSERHTPRESDFYNVTGALESSKVYRRPADVRPNCNPTYNPQDYDRQRTRHEEMYMYAGKGATTDERSENVRKLSANASANHDCVGSANCSEAVLPVVGDTDGEETVGRNRLPIDERFNLHSGATDRYHGHNYKRCTNNATNETKDTGDCVSLLSGGDLRVLERPPPTPEPSIHVEMQEYTSDDESDRLKRTSKIGWTFYNNVLGQVNEILQNSSITNDKDAAESHARVEQAKDTETKTALDNVKVATLEQLRRLGISLTENNEPGEPNGNNRTLDFDSSFYPRLDRQANVIRTTSGVNDTNTSMHMKALALKYLSDQQLADIALHKQESSSLKHVLLSNMEGTNMSFATMRYLERYQLLPGKNNVQAEDTRLDRLPGEVAPKADPRPAKNNPAARRFPFAQTTAGTTCPNKILDLSTLKRQPKLL